MAVVRGLGLVLQGLDGVGLERGRCLKKVPKENGTTTQRLTNILAAHALALSNPISFLFSFSGRDGICGL